jgi:hypothetical protein
LGEWWKVHGLRRNTENNAGDRRTTGQGKTDFWAGGRRRAMLRIPGLDVAGGRDYSPWIVLNIEDEVTCQEIVFVYWAFLRGLHNTMLLRAESSSNRDDSSPRPATFLSSVVSIAWKKDLPHISIPGPPAL